MSLEDKVAELTGAIQVLTDALQQHAVAVRASAANVKLPEGLPQAPGKPATAPPPAPTAAAPKPPGRPKKETPPPAPLAVDDTASTQGTAQAAGDGSAQSGDELLTYDDLKEVVPQVAEKLGRAKVLALYADFGLANGQELQAKHPDKIPDVVRAFRAALAGDADLV